MITLSLTPQDLTQVRFAFSPLWEVVASLRVLRAPDRHALHLGWARRTREVVSPNDLAVLFALVPPQGYVPDFLTPPPTTPFPDFAEELALVRVTPPDVVLRDIGEAFAAQSAPDVGALSRYLSEPEASLDALMDVLERYWTLALSDDWPQVQHVLEHDVQTRARTLALHGPEALFNDLHSLTTYTDGILRVGIEHWDWSGSAAGRGLLLLPSVFAWPSLYVTVEEPWQPTVAYTALGSANLWWDEPQATADAARILLGERQAALLSLLRAPMTTQKLARQLQLTPSAVSQRVVALKSAGLVTSTRSGRFVWHQLSERGSRVLRAISDNG